VKNFHLLRTNQGHLIGQAILKCVGVSKQSLMLNILQRSMSMFLRAKYLESRLKSSKELGMKDNSKRGLIGSNAECGLGSFLIAL
jgi:hypothetical protein